MTNSTIPTVWFTVNPITRPATMRMAMASQVRKRVRGGFLNCIISLVLRVGVSAYDTGSLHCCGQITPYWFAGNRGRGTDALRDAHSGRPEGEVRRPVGGDPAGRRRDPGAAGYLRCLRRLATN